MTAPRIALLDNDSACLSLMHDLLTDEGYRTLRCRPSDVMDMHALLRRMRPNLVILDSWLGRRNDGWEFLTRISADVETTHIPAIIVTGEPEALPVQADALRALRCQVVRKPFDLQDLLTAIAAVLGPSPAMGPRGDRAHAPLSVEKRMKEYRECRCSKKSKALVSPSAADCVSVVGTAYPARKRDRRVFSDAVVIDHGARSEEIESEPYRAL